MIISNNKWTSLAVGPKDYQWTELVSFVLLAALIGGITLARKDEALIDEDQI